MNEITFVDILHLGRSIKKLAREHPEDSLSVLAIRLGFASVDSDEREYETLMELRRTHRDSSLMSWIKRLISSARETDEPPSEFTSPGEVRAAYMEGVEEELKNLKH